MSRDRRRSHSRHRRDHHDSGGQRRSRDRSSSSVTGGRDRHTDSRRVVFRSRSRSRPPRDFSPPRNYPSYRGRNSPQRGRVSPIRPPGNRYVTEEIVFHDDQVRECLMANENKFRDEITQKFPGVSRIDLRLKKRIEFSGSPGSVKVKKTSQEDFFSSDRLECIYIFLRVG